MTMASMAMWTPAIKKTPLRILRQQQQRVSSCQHITDQGGGGTLGPRLPLQQRRQQHLEEDQTEENVISSHNDAATTLPRQ